MNMEEICPVLRSAKNEAPDGTPEVLLFLEVGYFQPKVQV